MADLTTDACTGTCGTQRVYHAQVASNSIMFLLLCWICFAKVLSGNPLLLALSPSEIGMS